MVPLVSFLAALRILTEAQICNNGEGKVVFEKVTAFQSTSPEFLTNSSQYEIITRTNTPPLKVLEECFHRCQEDRVNKIGTCNKFDFLPGKRLSEKESNLRKRTPKNVGDVKGKKYVEYDQSSCVLYNQANGSINWDDISNNHGSVWQFDKTCLSSQHINKNCPNRPFVYEKVSSFKLIDGEQGKELSVSDKNECENKCLMERDFTCRSASFKSSENKCYLSPLNRHVAPSEFKPDPEFEYLENMCLKNNEMCKWSVLIIENQKQMDPKYEKHSTSASSMNNCSTSCLESLDKYGFVCRSFMYDEESQQCILYDEDPADMASNSNETDSKLITSNGTLYRVLCSTDDKDKELDNKTLECYRHKRLRGRHQMEMYAHNFYECLNGCMKKFGANCRSIEYSHSQKICRFSAGTVVGPVSNKDTDALIDDDSFDYYQFMWNDDGQPYNGQMTGPMSDRHDAIETSYSQPGNYKNFILPTPTERARDHHRGGLAYNNNNNNARPNGNSAYPYNHIEQKQQPDQPDQYDRSQSGSAYPSPVQKPQQPASSSYDGRSPNYPSQDRYEINQISGKPDQDAYDRSNQIYSQQPEMDQYGRTPQSRPYQPQIGSNVYDPNNQMYGQRNGQPHSVGYDQYGRAQHPSHGSINYDPSSGAYNIPQQRETEFVNFDGTPGSYPNKPGVLDRYEMNQISGKPESDSNKYDPNSMYGGIKPNQPGLVNRMSPMMPNRPAQHSIVYPSPTYIYHIEQEKQPEMDITGRTPTIHNIPRKPQSSQSNDRSSSMANKPMTNYNVRPSQQISSNVVYPSPTYTYQIEQVQQPDLNGHHTPPISQMEHRKPHLNDNPNNKYEQTSQIQSQIYPVPKKPLTYIYSMQSYNHSQPYMIDYKISPTPTRPSMPSSTTFYQGRSGTIPQGTMINGSMIMPGSNDYSKSRISSIQYPGQNFNMYGYSMPRTPANVITNGGFSTNGNYVNNYTKFMPGSVGSYGPVGSMSHMPFAGVHQTQIGPMPASHMGPTQVAYDRYGHLSPGSTTDGQASRLTSNGCNTNLQTTVASFKKLGISSRLKSKHIYKVARAERLEDCERFCLETKDFLCKSFNFRPFFPDNCELSSVDTKKFKLDDSNNFEHNTQFDYYERDESKVMMSMPNSMDCFEVLQTCSPEGMELKLITPEGFYGRIYTYGFYDSCYFDGNGGTSSILKISKPNGFPRCGTQQINPDAMTNIVVVQFNDYVQTSRDKKYNLTCLLSGPGEAVVTSNYLDTKTDGRHPMQIEHLPAQNMLTSNIVLRILYRGTPTNTIVVGDLLTFRLEARNPYRINGYYNDIFATNVIAKDPYTGRQVLLIDSRGCPVDLYVFPELHRTPDGALEAEFYAFKIPDSNFLVFQATVKTCKGPCEPVICKERSRGQSAAYSIKGGPPSGNSVFMDFPSWGRKRRSINKSDNSTEKPKRKSDKIKEEEEVHELLRVYLSAEDVPESQMLQRPQEPPMQAQKQPMDKMCIDKTAYYLLFIFSILFFLSFTIILPYCLLSKWMKSRYENKKIDSHPYYVGWMSKWPRMSSFMIRPKTSAVNNQNLSPTIPSTAVLYGQVQRTKPQQQRFQNDYHQTQSTTYNEPIYQDLSTTATIDERCRSQQSMTVHQDHITNTTKIHVGYD